MQVAKGSHSVMTSGVRTDIKFGLDLTSDPAKIFDVLTKYTFPIKAVVREICCNALDAHRSIKQTIPFEVCSPNAVVPTFRVRDFGPGLDKDKLVKVFCTYLASTKDGSQEFIGGFGLGSKSPFAYTDSFTVTSWHGGRKSVWLMFRGPDRCPTPSMVSDEPSDEPSGVEVCVPVTASDFGNFRTECMTVLKWFPKGSFDAVGFMVQHPTLFHQNERWAFLTDPFEPKPTWQRFDDPVVIMGNVAYTVDFRSIKGFNYERGLVLFFDIGDLSLPYSREYVVMDDRVTKGVQSRILEIREFLKTQIEERVKACTNIWDATCTVNKFQSGLQPLGFSRPSVNWDGKDVGFQVMAKLPPVYKVVSADRLKLITNQLRTERYISPIAGPVTARSCFILDDLPTDGKQHREWARLRNNLDKFRDFEVVVIVPPDTDLKNDLKDPPPSRVFKLSELQPPEIQRGTATKSVGQTEYFNLRFDGKRPIYISNRAFADDILSFNTTAKYYITMDGKSAAPVDNIPSVYAHLPHANPNHVLGLTPTAINRMGDDMDELIPLKDYVVQEIEAYTKDPNFQTKVTEAQVFHDYRARIAERFNWKYTKDFLEMLNDPGCTWAFDLMALEVGSPHYSRNELAFFTVAHDAGLMSVDLSGISDIVTLKRDIVEKNYPMAFQARHTHYPTSKQTFEQHPRAMWLAGYTDEEWARKSRE